MVSLKKLIKMAKKWQKLAVSKRKRISYPRTTWAVDAESCSTSSVAQKGHFVLYTADQRRFEIPLKYLENNIIRELFIVAADEFGLPGIGPITLTCDAIFMEYVISLIQRHAPKDLEKALLMSLVTAGHCKATSNLYQEQSNPQLLCSF